MNNKIFYIIVLCLTLVLTSIFAINKANHTMQTAGNKPIKSTKTVVIDAGHGGKDAGTTADDGTEEKAINLDIAMKLYDFLMFSGINAVLIRDGDYELYPEGSDKSRSDLYNRLDFVNEIPEAVLISIHQNHFEDRREWGTQIWYTVNDTLSKELADKTLSNIKSTIQPNNNRENKPSGSSYYLLYKASVPSIMIECGFMSNTEENNKLKDPEYQNILSFLILTGICEDV